MKKCDFCVKSNPDGTCGFVQEYYLFYGNYYPKTTRETYCREAIDNMIRFYNANQINNSKPSTGGSVMQDD